MEEGEVDGGDVSGGSLKGIKNERGRVRETDSHIVEIKMIKL